MHLLVLLVNRHKPHVRITTPSRLWKWAVYSTGTKRLRTLLTVTLNNVTRPSRGGCMCIVWLAHSTVVRCAGWWRGYVEDYIARRRFTTVSTWGSTSFVKTHVVSMRHVYLCGNTTLSSSLSVEHAKVLAMDVGTAMIWEWSTGKPFSLYHTGVL